MDHSRFGAIFRCFSFAAYMVIDKRRLSNATYHRCLVNEPNLMTLLSPHPHILRILDARETDDRLSLILELYELDTLYSRISSRMALPEPEATTYFGSVAWSHEGGSVEVAMGTLYYDAPEVLMGREYDEEVDVDCQY
ncbi:hypothetical protein ACJRO7_032708 [Eucalyptus globulus]|uniref:Protein kinase domain-containing protein n=1 Tax=Eucalyptus globulus TaxID=34317 RepID=A0ABD3JP43_EUCGL